MRLSLMAWNLDGRKERLLGYQEQLRPLRWKVTISAEAFHALKIQRCQLIERNSYNVYALISEAGKRHHSCLGVSFSEARAFALCRWWMAQASEIDRRGWRAFWLLFIGDHKEDDPLVRRAMSGFDVIGSKGFSDGVSASPIAACCLSSKGVAACMVQTGIKSGFPVRIGQSSRIPDMHVCTCTLSATSQDLRLLHEMTTDSEKWVVAWWTDATSERVLFILTKYIKNCPLSKKENKKGTLEILRRVYADAWHPPPIEDWGGNDTRCCICMIEQPCRQYSAHTFCWSYLV